MELIWPRNGCAEPPTPEQSRIGRFVIERTLGQGGYGIVYLALDPALGRRVALKVPRLHALGDAELLDRFKREARAAAALDHPNIVPVHETGQIGKVHSIASAYCPGLNLAQWLKQQSGSLSPRNAARIVICLAEAAHYSHSRGVLHRDIKPGNVMLVPRADEPTNGDLPFVPRLGDFGLAKLIERGLAGATQHPQAMTATEQMLSTALSKNIVAGRIGGAMSAGVRQSASTGAPVGTSRRVGTGQIAAPPVSRASRERQPHGAGLQLTQRVVRTRRSLRPSVPAGQFHQRRGIHSVAVDQSLPAGDYRSHPAEQ